MSKMSIIHSTVLIISTFFLVHPSQAWTNVARTRLSLHDNNVLHVAPAPSVALHQDDTCQQESHTFNLINALDTLDTELRLEAALEAARDADRQHGLCTPTSARAWKVVDDIYSDMATNRHVEEDVRRASGTRSLVSLPLT